ncbi:hypothetical protein KM043_006432 [Ampulex compressa]|nr:hypothetical protein KM043_006432 [Ampulex compressa]
MAMAQGRKDGQRSRQTASTLAVEREPFYELSAKRPKRSCERGCRRESPEGCFCAGKGRKLEKRESWHDFRHWDGPRRRASTAGLTPIQTKSSSNQSSR